MFKLIRSAAVALMMIPTTSSAEDFGAGMAAYRAGDFATALSEWTPLAEQGSADAQFFLGTMHDKGEAVPQDAAEAVKWWRLAAEQGDSSAQFMVGSRYANGTGVPQDYAEAVKWLRLAAEQGDVLAQLNLGDLYANGQEGVPQDYGLVAYSCRSKCSFRPPRVRRPRGFFLPMLNADGVGYRSR